VKPIYYWPWALQSSDFNVSRLFLKQFYLSFSHFCYFSSLNIQIFAYWLKLVCCCALIRLKFLLKGIFDIAVEIFFVFFKIDSSRALKPFKLVFLHDLSHKSLMEGFVFFFIYWLIKRDIILLENHVRIHAFNCFYKIIFIFCTLGLKSFLVNDIS